MKFFVFALLTTGLVMAQDKPIVIIRADTNDPAFLPPGLPGLVACAPNCLWYAVPMVFTSDSTSKAFVVDFAWKTIDGTAHTGSARVMLRPTSGGASGLGFLVTGTDQVLDLHVTGWLRVSEIHAEADPAPARTALR